MRLEGTYLFAAPREAVWEALMDPAVLAGALPGGEQLEQTGENQYRAVMNVKVGPVQGRFEGKILLEDIVAPQSYLMKVDGQGAPGFVAGEGRLATGGGGRRWHGTALWRRRNGRRAHRRRGAALIESTAKSITRQGLQALDQTIAARLAGPAGRADRGAGKAGACGGGACAPGERAGYALPQGGSGINPSARTGPGGCAGTAGELRPAVFDGERRRAGGERCSQGPGCRLHPGG